MMFVGPVNSVWVHFLWEKSTFTAKKKEKKKREKRDVETQET